MSTEYINRITVKKDGVYLSSHSSTDSRPYHSWRCESLSDVYAAEGQKGLDREIVCMLYEYAELRGSHKSLERYRYATEAPEAHNIYKKYVARINKHYESLSEREQKLIWFAYTEEGKKYRAYDREERKKMYEEIAARCEEYDAKQKAEKEAKN